jgi:ACS family tartrate transporter-like MFS transporter
MHDESTLQRETVVRVARRLIPLIVISYLVAHIDRANIAFAALTMNRDLGFSAYIYGWGAGIFFLGYALFEVPSNLILVRIGARIWIARIMITWGILAGLMATVTGPSSFLTLRFLLGVAEAGFWPGILLYLTFWFPARYRARAIGALYLAVPASNVVAAAISSTLLQLDGFLGLKGWQWVFIGEAVPALVLVPVVLRLLTDRPGVAAWLRPAQRDWLEAELQRERVEVERGGHLGLAQALTDRRVLTLAIVSMFHLVSLSGLTFFMPQMVKALGTSTAMAAALTAIPYVIGVIGPIAAGYSSDRLKERRWHYIGAMALAALSLVCAGRVISSYWLLLATSGAALGIYASKPCFWPIPSQFLTGVGAAAGIALINSIANVGGYVGPLVVGWVKDSTHSFEAALYFLAACALASALLAYVGTRTVGRAL